MRANQQQVTTEFIHKLIALFGTEDTPSNCTQLNSLLNALGDASKSAFLFETTDTTTGIKGERHMSLAALAIIHGKSNFFNMIADKYPEVICSQYFFLPPSPIKDASGNVALVSLKHFTPLECAIYIRIPALASTVLTNINFIDHEYNNPELHKEYLNACKSFAEALYKQPRTAEEIKILSILQSAISI